MARFVPDVKSNRWVIIAPGRVKRPHDSPVMPDQDTCPFCPGHEDINPTIYSFENVRVINNKYPITSHHEVIIHSPNHDGDFQNLPLNEVENILKTFRERYIFHQNNGQVLIFNNHDIHAGASLTHPHSQLVVIPRQINLETLSKEPVQNEVCRTNYFIAYCPDFSQWPYEIWIAPNHVIPVDAGIYMDPGSKPGMTNFGQITDEQIADLAPLLQKFLGIIHQKFPGENDVPYNFYIYHGNDWYLRIIPRFVHRAGLELGTGLSVNIVDPATAAKEYREGK